MAKFSLDNYDADSVTARDAAKLLAPLVDISDTELTVSKLPAIIGDLTSDFSGVTVLSFPDLVEVVGKFTPGLLHLVTLNLPALVTVVGHFIPVDASPSLISIDLSSLVTVGGDLKFNSMPNLTSVDLSSLVSVGTLARDGADHGGTFSASGGTGLTSIDLSSLSIVQNHFDPQLASLTSLALPAITSIGGDFDIYSEEITSITWNSGLKKIGGLVSLEGAGKLAQASVDHILVRLAALNGTGGTTSFDNKTVDLSGGTNASPSATGLTAKATLEGRGNTVTVN